MNERSNEKDLNSTAKTQRREENNISLRLSASAVKKESEITIPPHALIFVGESGAGKSTLAALMMAHGCHLVTDDFLPVALESPEVCPLPTAISVKRNAIPFLSRYFPVLAEEEYGDEEEDEVFLPLQESHCNLSPIPAKAIIFVQYDPSTPFSLTRESNLAMMNDFLKQSWIANNPAAAERFLQWYFSLPVWSLAYSNPERAVSGLLRLLET